VQKQEWENEITPDQWLSHAKRLYEIPFARRKLPRISMEEIIFTTEDVEDGIRKLAAVKGISKGCQQSIRSGVRELLHKHGIPLKIILPYK
jgi:hypothetical protein